MTITAHSSLNVSTTPGQSSGDDSQHDSSSQFLLEKQPFGNQYASMYFCRLVLLRKHFLNEPLDKEGKLVPTVMRLSDVRPETHCRVIGTLYKAMKLKPSALKTYLDMCDVEGAMTALCDESDTLVLEDESGRFKLEPDIGSPLKIGQFLTGMIIGVIGKLRESGSFLVSDIEWPRLPNLIKELPLKQTDENCMNVVAFVANLGFGGVARIGRRRQRLHDFITTAHEFRIQRLIIAGNTTIGVSKTRNLSVLKEADAFLASLAASVNIDLMPGQEDPTGSSLPQQPIPGVLLPECRRFSSFNRVTNPHSFTCDKVRFIGSSGQPISDVIVYSENRDPLEALKLTLRGRCLAPTAPDTLSCYPFGTEDPFTLGNDERFPHAIFSAVPYDWEENSAVPPAQISARMDNGSLALYFRSDSNRVQLTENRHKYNKPRGNRR